MPAAAVIPAPIAYIKVAAVKTLVVGSLWAGRVVALDTLTCGALLWVPFRVRRPAVLRYARVPNPSVSTSALN